MWNKAGTPGPEGHVSGPVPYGALPTVSNRPAAGAMPSGRDFVAEFCNPDLITHESGRPLTAKQKQEIVDQLQGPHRAGAGEIIRDTRSTHHECEPPDEYVNDLTFGTIWRCDCGRRYTLNPDGGGGAHWLRRFWPWPR